MAVAITRTDDPVSAGSGVTITYSAVATGVAATDRIIAVCVNTELSSGTPSSATIDYGAGALAMQATALASFGSNGSRIFYLGVPTGTTANIAVTFGASQGSTTQHICAYRVTGARLLSSGINTNTDFRDTAVTTGSITIPTNGGFIGTVCAAGGGGVTWTNATEDLDEVIGAAYSFSTATRTTALAATAVTCVGSLNNEDGTLAWVMFGPGADASAGLAGASTASVNATIPPVVRQGTSVFVGSSVLSATAAQNWATNTAKLAAGSLLITDSKRYIPATAMLANTSAVALDATVITSWVSGIYDETGATNNLSLAAGRYTEFEFGLVLDPNILKAGDVLTFRLRNDVTELDSYDQEIALTVSAHNIAGTALLGGVSAVALDAIKVDAGGVKTWFDSAVLVGDSAIIASVTTRLVAASTLAATSSLASNALRYVQGTTIFAGASALVTNAQRYSQATALLAGTSSVAVDGKRYVFATTLLAGVGSLASDSKSYLVATATLPNFSSIALDAIKVGGVFTWFDSAVFVGDSSLASTSSIALTAKVTLAGASSLSATGSIALTAAVALAGAGNLAATASLINVARATLPATSTQDTLAVILGAVYAWPDSAVLIGTATLALDTSQRLVVNATLPVSSGISVAATAVWPSSAKWPLASALTANSSRYQLATTQFAAASLLSALTSLRLPALSTLPANSTMVTAEQQRLVAQATLRHTSSIALDAVILGAVYVWQDSALFTGAATAAVATTQWLAAKATLPVVATLAAVHFAAMAGRSQWDATGSLVANSNRYQLATSLLVGSSTLAADSRRYQLAAAILAGDSSLSALLRQQQLARETLAGATSLSLDGVILGAVYIWQDSAVLIGATALAANAGWLLAARSTFIASSLLAADTSQRFAQQGSSLFVGTGSLAANVLWRLAAVTTLAGSSTLAASSTQRFQQYGTAALTGASSLSATSRLALIAAARFAGDSALFADTRTRFAITASLPAVGNLSAAARTNAMIRATLAALSVMRAESFSFGADAIFPEPFAVGSGMIINAYRPVHRLRDRTTLRGNVVAGIRLQGEVRDKANLEAA